MAVTLRDLLEHEPLRLRCMAGEEQLDQEIRWVHVSEILDPTPWLQGGEFLMTTGLPLSDERSMRAYVHRLADHKLSGIGFGTGAGAYTPYAVVPDAVLVAARHRGLPVLEVPFDTPYVAVSEFVTTKLASEQLLTVQRAYDVQRQLTTAALEPRGWAEVVRLLAAATEAWCAVTTSKGELLDAAPGRSAKLLGPLALDLERARVHGTVSHIVSESGSSTAIHPLGARHRTRQLLVVIKDGPLNQFDRMVIAGAVTLLSIDAERRFGFSPERHMASEKLGALALRRGALPQDRIDALTTVGFSGAAVTLARFSMPGIAGRAIAEGVNDILFERGVPHCFITDPADVGSSTLIVDADTAEMSRIVASIFDEFGQAGKHAGVSAWIGINELLLGFQQAEAALRHAVQSHSAMETFAQLPLHQILLEAMPDERLQATSDAVLGPLDRIRSPDRERLQSTLDAFLRNNGHGGLTANALGIHRQTLAKRLARLESILGSALGSPDTRAALWFALSARGMLAGARRGSTV
ncbi:MAG: hypothetical protein JWQ68_280 [Cryobacterium sp.]|jgi:purine catabolism regulator|nr:hypothetical protein [Cryobacterium sp.]